MFITDVRLFNRGSAAAQLTAVFTPTGADGTARFAAANVIVPPLQVVALNDVVQSVFQSTGTGQLELAGAADQIIANSRTYTPGGHGTYGQFVPSAFVGEAIGSGDASISVPGLENTPGFRSNIGFAEVSGAAGEVHVRYFDASGAVVADEVYGIAPFGHVQTRVNPTGEALRAEVTVAGAARVLAYGSMVDNTSGDAIFIPAARDRQGFIPLIHSPGVNGTLWRTDVWFSYTAPPVHASVCRDCMSGPGVSFGFVGAPNVIATSRTYTTSASGTFGQFIPPGTPSTELRTLIGIENGAAFRTNIGLIAPAPATARVIAYDAAGREVWRSDVSASGVTQFALPVPLADGRVTVEVVGGNAVLPYASVVDNASGDPTFIVAR
jgi:hypothetical protein